MADKLARGQAGPGAEEHGRRLQEVATGEFAPEVYTRDAWSAGIGLGRAYIIGSGRITLGLAGNVRGVVTNPTGSGRNVTILAMTAFGTTTSYLSLYLDPTVGVPTSTARPTLPLRPSSDAPVSLVRVDTSTTTALAGGVDTGVTLSLPANVRVQVAPFGKILAPGQSMGVNMPFTSASDVSFNLYVVEE